MPTPPPDPPLTLFATTRWTLVVDAARGAETTAIDALGELVHTNWQPLYCDARRKGESREDADDLVQGFMPHLIEARSLDSADHEWALALLAKVLHELEAISRAEGSGEPFDHLRPCLTAASQKIPYAEIATDLGVTEGALRVAVHRLRKRYRTLHKAEITPDSPDSVENEMHALFAALSAYP